MSACFLIAGGGTGGHVFPGLAVADALCAVADVDVRFAGTARGIESRVIPARGYQLDLLKVEPLKGVGALKATKGALVAARATLAAFALVRKVKPTAILSVGGYAAGPVALAGVSLGVPVAVLEPNSMLGLTNRVLARFCKRAYVAWPELADRIGAERARVYGVPLRSGFAPRPYAPGDTARVLVLGGSQGAVALNERLPAALAQVKKTLSVLEVVHQAGRDRSGLVRKAYEKANMHVDVRDFIDDMPAAMEWADVVVARSGAGTVAEIAALGRASILVPFPFAADDHQFKNAMSLAQLGGAVCIRQDDATVERLGVELSKLLLDPAQRVRMADAANGHGKPHAAADIARDLLGLAGVAPKSTTNGGARGSSTNGAHSSRRNLEAS
jgi:UDP-N-acetylglucosamine--N-acetylmuramyl-(pentapeptide) pyrophosphoryl-undecaprenol N-acetylglucosamine transferase